MEVKVNNKLNFEVAIRSFRRRSQQAGIVREAKSREFFLRPSEKRKLKAKESLKRRKKNRRNFKS